MSDTKEPSDRTTPESADWTAVLNPFESPSDCYSLHEPIVSSPTIFKACKSAATPLKFRWSIDQIATHNPVDIDPEDVHRQTLYLSHAHIDKEMEERKQRAIEEFFTKSIIVPSPWTRHEGKQISQFHSTKCVDFYKESPNKKDPVVQSGKNNVACQTLLSLPLDFNLEAILGEYFKSDENADQSQESLSSSSLRRKLFLDGNGSGSECSSPPSPQEVVCDKSPTQLDVICAVDLSPVRCRSPMLTPGSGHFSSSPIQGGSRAYSFGSTNSPTFLERSPCNIASPTVSPIAQQLGRTPTGTEQRKLTFTSPDVFSVPSCSTSSHSGSPYIHGCSPIKSFFPLRPRSCRGSAQYRTNIRVPSALCYHEEADKENSLPEETMPRDAPADLQQVNSTNGFACLAPLGMEVQFITALQSDNGEHGSVSLQNIDALKENNTVDMVDPVEVEEDAIWVKETAGIECMPTTSFITGIRLSAENSHMCLSPLAESSVIPCESSSIQVDSGYNTQACASSIMDGIGSESSCRESEMHICEVQNKCRHVKTKELPTFDGNNQLLEMQSLDNIPLSLKSTACRSCSQTAHNVSAWKSGNELPFYRVNKNARIHSPSTILDVKSNFMPQNMDVSTTKQ
ncbi:protein aurora borealis isoform X2 [Ambystoma mexicanum]|uniref:protein aurora borealis isoform X2 n=1 Tax=Ambystoma mexicanum TaxID=8296 RepID=UPI0037E972D2